MLGWRVIPRVGFGDFGVSPHGLGIAFGVFIGAWIMARRARRIGYSEDDTWNGAAVGVVGAILGARIAYVGGHASEFASPTEWLKIWTGGISLVGGLLGAFIAVAIFTKVKRISFFELVDLGAPGLGIGIALGRIGDLLIGDHLGKQTSGWWGWRYVGGELISPPRCTYNTFDGCIHPGMVVHQTALYDMAWSLVIFAILLLLGRKSRNKGFLFLSWAGLYAMGRIATDFARVDKHWFGLSLTGSQLTSIGVLAVVAFLLIRYRGIPPKEVPVGFGGDDGPAPVMASVMPGPLSPSTAATAEEPPPDRE